MTKAKTPDNGKLGNLENYQLEIIVVGREDGENWFSCFFREICL